MWGGGVWGEGGWSEEQRWRGVYHQQPYKNLGCQSPEINAFASEIVKAATPFVYGAVTGERPVFEADTKEETVSRFPSGEKKRSSLKAAAWLTCV